MNGNHERMLILAIIYLFLIGYSMGCGFQNDFPVLTSTKTPRTSDPIIDMPTKTIQSTLEELDKLPISQSPTPRAIRSDGTISLVDLARQDLAIELNISEDQIEINSIQTKRWSVTSMDCPLDDRHNPTVYISGYRLELFVDDILYIYKTDVENSVILCDIKISLPFMDEYNVQDGWPNQSRDGDMIIITPKSLK